MRTVPVEGIANFNSVEDIDQAGDSERQLVDRVADTISLNSIGVVTASGATGTTPSIGLASLFHHNRHKNIIGDNKMHRINSGTVVIIAIMVTDGTRSSVSEAVPSVGITSGIVVAVVDSGVEGEEHRVDRVAKFVDGIGHGIAEKRCDIGVGDIGERIGVATPSEGIARNDTEGVGSSVVVDGQQEHSHRIASRHTGSRITRSSVEFARDVGLIGGLIVSDAVASPSVGLTSLDSIVERHQRVEGELETEDRVADTAYNILFHLTIRHGVSTVVVGLSDAVPEPRIRLVGADRSRSGVVDVVKNRKFESVGTRARTTVEVVMRISAILRVSAIMPRNGLTDGGIKSVVSTIKDIDLEDEGSVADSGGCSRTSECNLSGVGVFDVIAIPSEGVASVNRVADNDFIAESKRDAVDRVADVVDRMRSGVSIETIGSECVAMPEEGVARDDTLDGSHHVVIDQQFESIDRMATIAIEVMVLVGTGSVVDSAMPNLLFADGVFHHKVARSVECEVLEED